MDHHTSLPAATTVFGTNFINYERKNERRNDKFLTKLLSSPVLKSPHSVADDLKEEKLVHLRHTSYASSNLRLNSDIKPQFEEEPASATFGKKVLRILIRKRAD